MNENLYIKSYETVRFRYLLCTISGHVQIISIPIVKTNKNINQSCNLKFAKVKNFILYTITIMCVFLSNL